MKQTYIKLVMTFLVMIVGVHVNADEIPVAILKGDTLTFTYADASTATATNGEDGTYQLNEGSKTPGWTNGSSKVKRVVFDSKFVDARPTSTSHWFYKMQSLISVIGLKNLNTSNVTDMSYMFSRCNLLKLDFSGFNTSKVSNMEGMFCQSNFMMLNLASFITDNVTNMKDMFAYTYYHLKDLNLSSFNTEKVTTMYGMFKNSGSCLKRLDLSSFNTKNVTDMDYMFFGFGGAGTDEVNGSPIYTEITFGDFNNAKVTSMQRMFYECNLSKIDFNKFYTPSVTNMREMFKDCAYLKTLDLSTFDTKNVTSMANMFSGCISLTSLNVRSFNTEKLVDGNWWNGYYGSYGMFSRCSSLKSLDLSSFKMSNENGFVSMFEGCSSLESLDLSSFVTEKVISMRRMFCGCTNLKTIILSNFNTALVYNMSEMFSGCSSLVSLDLSSFVTEKVTSMRSMFSECTNLKELDISNFDTKSVKDMSEMFRGCSSLVSLELNSLKTSNVTTMKNMFARCTNLKELDISNFDTKSVKDMSNMFSDCSSLAALDISNFNTDSCTNFANMFSNCKWLTSIDLKKFKTDNVTDMSQMFYNCSELSSIDLSNFNTQNVTTISGMFYNCSDLESVDLSKFNSTNVATMDTIFYHCSKLKQIIVNNNDFANVGSKVSAFAGVGTVRNPCTLAIGTDFDRTVLGDLVESTPSYYKWLGGYFMLSDANADTDLSELDNAIYVENTKGRIGKSLELSVKMKNTAAIQGYQFDLYLPDGVTVAKDADGLNEASLSTARTTEKRTNYFDSEIQADSALRVLCYSSKGYTFEGNDGEVAKVVVNISSAMSEGDFPIIIKNIVLSDSANVRYKCDYVKSTLTLSAYTLGDVNGDGEIDVTDVTTASNYILGRSTEVFIKEAADVNGDGEIDVADATLISNYILGRATFEEKAKAKAMIVTSGSNDIYMKSTYAPLNSQKKVEVSISNVDAFASYQFDITVPAGIKVADISQNNIRTTGKGLFQWNEVSDGLYRVIYVSLTGNGLTGNDGPVADVLLETNNTSSEGLAAINISNTKLSLDGNVIKVPDASCNIAIGSTTGIDGIGVDATNKVDVYTISGQKVRSQAPATDSLKGLPRGIYIINGKKIIK